VVTAISSLSTTSALCGGNDLGPGLAILTPSSLLLMVVVCFVLYVTPVLDVVVVALLVFHDAVDRARGPYLRSYSARPHSSPS
jgi:hypothetical protein